MSTPPRIPRLKAILNIPHTVRKPLEAFQAYAKTYGDDYLFAVGGSRRTHMTTNPDVFQHVLQKNHRNYEKSEIQTVQVARYFGFGLLTNSGQDWLTQRRLIQPGFNRKRLQRLTEEMREVIRQQCDELAAATATGATVNLYHFTRGAVFKIIVRAIFTDGFLAAESARLHEIIEKVQGYIIYPVRAPFLRGPLRWAGLEKEHLDLMVEVRANLQQKIEERRAGPAKDDLLQMLLEARYEDNGEPMSDERLIDEIMIIFAAGHETSANSLAWTVWLLLHHPEDLAEVQAEIKAARALGPVDFEGVRRLPYLTQVIEESMRLYPPAWIIDRVALADDCADGLDIETGTVIGLFIYGLHRNPKLWEAPDEFRPARMTAAAKKSRHPMAYLPFGGGPRLCIGNHFAMLEMQLLLAELLDRFELELTDPAALVKGKPTITLHQDREIGIRIVKDRKD